MNNGRLQHFYPDFVPNQVLTNTQLNSLRTYLDQQTRLSRIRLTGHGIICGLTWSLSGTGGAGSELVLTITGGYGLTSRGYLVDLEETAYTRCYAYTDPRQDEDGDPRYEPWQTGPDDRAQIELLALLGEETESEEEISEEIHPLTVDQLVDKVVVVYLEARDEQLKSCLVTDCNNKGVNVELTVRVLLVNVSDLEAQTPCEPPDPPVQVPRLHAALEDLTFGDIEDAGQINRTYGTIVKDVWEPLSEQLREAYDTYGVFLDVPEDVLELIDETGTRIDDRPEASFNQYHYDFVKDLRTAYEEFLQVGCRLIHPCFSSSAFPRHLMLGAVDGADGYRSSFRAAPVRNVLSEDLERAGRLFQRIFSLLAAFNTAPVEDLRITPSHTERHVLGKRAVPFYYGEAGEGLPEVVQRFWQPEDCCTTAPLQSYYGNNGAALDHAYSAYSFLRIEGHLDQACETVTEALETLKRANNLEFDIRAVALGSAAEESEIIREIDELLERIDATWRRSPFWIRSVSDLLKERDDIDWEGESPWHVRSEVTELKSELTARYQDWQAIRGRTDHCCDLSALQADYLEARTELLSTYEQVFQYLDTVLDFLLQLPALISEKLPEIVGEEDLEATEERVRTRISELDEEISGLESNLAEAGETAERAAIREELAGLRETRSSITHVRETIRLTSTLSRSLREIYMPAAAAEPAEEGEPEVPTAVLLIFFGFLQEVMRLRDTVHELVHYVLPRDLRAFNYLLFSREYQAIVRTMLEVRLLPVFLALYGAALSRRDDLPVPPLEELDEFFGGSFGESLGEGILEILGGTEETTASLNPFTARLITLVLRTIGALPYARKLLTGQFHNRTLSQLATIYHTMEHVREENCGRFKGLVRRHPGLEHLAGVEPGGTFVLVCEGSDGEDTEPTVVADFSLRGQVECCCEIDMDSLCLPPMAAPDYEIAVRPRTEDGEGDEGAVVDIHVVRNDYSLNDDETEEYDVEHERGLEVELGQNETEQGGHIELTRREDGSVKKGWVTYTNERPDFYGLDRFTYTVIDERCEASATGQVIVLVLPAFPFEAPRPATGTLLGTVRDVETNAGISGAEVTIRETGVSATTRDKGDFRIEEVSPGSYTLVATHPDYATASHAVDLTAGETKTVDIALSSEEQPVETGRLSVSVVDANTGEGITNFQHSIKHLETGESPSTVLIGGNTFVYNGLTPGPYEVTVSKLGYHSFVQVVEVEANATRSVTARLKQSIVIEEFDRGELSFQVVEIGMRERPAPEVSILVNGPGAENLLCTTGEDGTCRTDGLEAGEYIVSIEDRQISRTVSVLSGETTEVAFRLIARESFDLSLEAPVVGWVVETTNVNPEQAQSILVKTYHFRYTGYVRETEQIGTSMPEADAYTGVARLLGGVIPRAEVPEEELNTLYGDVSGHLLEALAQDESRSGYRTLLELSTSAYLDRWTTLNPSEVSQEAEGMFAERFAELQESGIDLTNLSERWQGAELLEEFRISSIERLLQIIRETG